MRTLDSCFIFTGIILQSVCWVMERTAVINF